MNNKDQAIRNYTHSTFWFGLAGLIFVLYLIGGPLTEFPKEWVLSPTKTLNHFMEGFVAVFGPVFKIIGWMLEWPVRWAQDLLQALPWVVTAAVFILISYGVAGGRLALFCTLSLLYMAVIGYWSESMNTLALVLISVPMAVLSGFGFGALGFYSRSARRLITPTLDLLQTIPAFAYLLPILILFGFGTTVGLVASILYAFPPMVRNTILGLRRVPTEIIEAGIMSGTTPAQLFWKVRLPAAQRQMLLGVNQTTMASLSMVIIASIIGGTNDIGWEVLQTMRKAQFGESLLAGFVIALIAMVLDRVTYNFATKTTKTHKTRYILAFCILAVLSVAAFLIPSLRTWPENWIFYPAHAMNDALNFVVSNYQNTIQAIKNTAFFYVLLPIKIGLGEAVSPFTWGFSLSRPIIWAYALLIAGITVWAFFTKRPLLAAFITLWGMISFIGLSNMPWLGFYLLLIAAAYTASGKSLAIGTALGFGFLLIAGVWPQSVLSLYLCGIAVLISFSLGTLLGILASENNTVSVILRPIMDTLQTMPLFVILIPFVMVFKIGEFTALLAIIAYAIVPAIRYCEHGLRNLPAEVIEAAQAIGCTRWQVLKRVKLPLALPAIMLGLNQTIIYGIGMLVIAALVGTSGLGQRIYVGLSDGDFGVGITAGIGMAIIAMTADRMTQSISRKQQKKLGLPLDRI